MRINVTGNAGSGKSTLSRQIASEFNLPLVEMDRLIWRPGWQRTSPNVSRKALGKLLESNCWVLDGVSRMGCQKADLIIFLDFSRCVCAWRCAKRNWRYLFSSRPSLPQRCPEWKIIPTLAKIIWLFPTHARPAILRDIENTKSAAVVIRTRADLTTFVKDLPNLRLGVCQHLEP